jgi:hypothetical protein
MVLNAAENLESDTVIMGIFIIGLFAFAFDLLHPLPRKDADPLEGAHLTGGDESNSSKSAQRFCVRNCRKTKR